MAKTNNANAKSFGGQSRRAFVCVLALFVACLALVCLGCSTGQQASEAHKAAEKPSAVSDVQGSPESSSASASSSASSAAAESRAPIDTASLAAETIIAPEDLASLDIDAQFTVSPIPDDVFARMDGVTHPDWCPATRDDLRYLRVLHVDADGNTRVGEMVVNQVIADDVCDIFRQLYDAGYPIERMRLPDNYGGDDEASMQANNTSAFNCRLIEGSGEMSWHGYGLAVDINPLYNPYYYAAQGIVLPTTAWDYVDRSVQTPYTLNRGDLCYQLFIERGFEWGGDWDFPYDYQHFEKPF